MATCHVLLDWLSLAVILKKRDDVIGQDCESLAQLLFVEISKSDSYEATKLLLQGCHSSWLKMRILELILENFDKRLIPQEYRHLLNKTLKLNKIVRKCVVGVMRDAKISINESNSTSTIVSRSGKSKSLHDCVKVHELRSESLYASFFKFHVLVKREQEFA